MRYLEQVIARRCINDLINAGFVVSVFDGEETTVKHSSDRRAVFAAMGTTDEDYLLAHRPGDAHGSRTKGWVRFIYGNEPEYVINDYTTSLEPVLVRTNALIAKLEA
jgi:hypothetical protein